MRGMHMKRNTLVTLLIVGGILGLMNGYFGVTGYLAMGERCPDGEGCADVRRVAIQGLIFATAGLSAAGYAAFRLFRGQHE